MRLHHFCQRALARRRSGFASFFRIAQAPRRRVALICPSIEHSRAAVLDHEQDWPSQTSRVDGRKTQRNHFASRANRADAQRPARVPTGSVFRTPTARAETDDHAWQGSESIEHGYGDREAVAIRSSGDIDARPDQS